MKQLTRFFPAALCGLAIVSTLSLNSCKDRFMTETKFDTVFVSNPDWDDSTWVPRQSGTNVQLFRTSFINASTGFMSGDRGAMFKTTNSGETWSALTATPQNNLNTSGGGNNYGLWFFDANNGIAVGDGLDVYHTADGAQTWSASSISTTFYLRSLCFINRNVGFLGTSDPSSPGQFGEIFRTNDGGQTWTQQVSSNGGIYCIKFYDAVNGVAVGREGVAYWTNDGGTSWHLGTTDARDLIHDVAYISPTVAFGSAAGASSGEIMKTTDGGHSWNTVLPLPYLCDDIATDGSKAITACGFGGNITESTDGGATWSTYQVGSGRWINITYPSPERALIDGALGSVETRHRQF